MSMQSLIEEYNRHTDRLTDYTMELNARSKHDMKRYFANLRNFPLEIVDELDIFYIGDATEMLIPKFLKDVEEFGVISPTNKKPIFHNRFVMPIKDINGKVINLVGYSKEANERYVYGTASYYRRRETMYGLENLKMAYDLGYAIRTEGITDTIRLRSMGYKNTFANCGTHGSDFIDKQLNRCRHGVIEIPDRDLPGKKASNKWHTLRSVKLNTFIQYKDIDEMCADSENTNNQAVVKEYIDLCIEWILMGQHNGYEAQHEEVTMYI